MKKNWLILALALCMACSAALADTISFSGTVEPMETLQLYVPTGVTIEEIPVREGETVTADTVIARLKTTKVYAAEDGTVTAVFGQPGDSAETVAERYGAVMYLEGKYTMYVSASTSKAFEAKANYIVHAGEEVYLVSRTRTADRGTGLITSVDGSNFTVLVTSGDFFLTDNIVVSREENHAAESRIGRGNLTRISPRAVTGSGTILSVAVQPGEEVRQGQLLFETIDASFDSPELARAEVKAGVDGVVASISATQGSTLTQSGLVASIYPQDRVWVKAEVTETDLSELTVGQQVKVELDWNQDHGVSYEGTVEMISALGTVGEESTTYPVYISFIPDENTRYSMSALVTTLEDGTAEAAQDGDGQEEAPEEAAEPEEDRRGGRPDSGDGVPEERPEGEGRQSGNP